MYAIHIGVVPDEPTAVPAVDGHEDPTTELRITLAGHDAYVSGSWACWGPADQESDGDTTLHVVATVDVDEDSLGDAVDSLRRSLDERVSRGSRLLDYVVVSDEAWSENQAVILPGGSTLWIPLPQG